MRDSINKSIRISLVVIEILIFLYTLTIFLFKEKLNTLVYPINVVFFMFLTFFSIIAFGYIKNKKTKQKDVIRNNVIAISFVYLAAIYLLGKTTAFQTTSIKTINIAYLAITVILMELFRYIFLNKCNRITYHQYIITFLLVLFELLVISTNSSLDSIPIQNFLTLIIITMIKQSVLTYLNYKYGFFPCIIYSAILTIFPILPMYPQLGNYLSIVFTTIYSAIIVYNCSKPFRPNIYI